MRRAEAGDATAIRELTRRAYAKWVARVGREPKPMTADYEAALREHRFDLLFVEGKLAALIETIFAFDHLMIENVAVAPERQGQGFGRKLIGFAEALAASAGMREVRLYTNKRFAENLRLYSKLGYRVEYEEEFSGGTVVHMMKPMQA